MRRISALIVATALALCVWVVPVLAQDAGYPTPFPTASETDFPSEPPVVPPAPEPSESEPTESEPPPVVPPASDPPPPLDPPDDPPSLAATGLAITTGLAAAAALLGGGTGLVRLARRRERNAP
jgi:hypothetical protein